MQIHKITLNTATGGVSIDGLELKTVLSVDVHLDALSDKNNCVIIRMDADVEIDETVEREIPVQPFERLDAKKENAHAIAQLLVGVPYYDWRKICTAVEKQYTPARNKAAPVDAEALMKAMDMELI